MNLLPALSSKGQLKIQQLAFVLVAFVILFGLAALFFLSVKFAGVRGDVDSLRHERAQELVQKLATTPEFSWTVEDCTSCVDLDKVLALKNQSGLYQSFWGEEVILLRVQQIYPRAARDEECTSVTYPSCSRITLIDRGTGYSTDEAFVALCRLEGQPVHTRCTLGKIIMGVKSA